MASKDISSSERRIRLHSMVPGIRCGSGFWYWILVRRRGPPIKMETNEVGRNEVLRWGRTRSLIYSPPSTNLSLPLSPFLFSCYASPHPRFSMYFHRVPPRSLFIFHPPVYFTPFRELPLLSWYFLSLPSLFSIQFPVTSDQGYLMYSCVDLCPFETSCSLFGQCKKILIHED